MRNVKKIIVAIIVMLILLLISGGVFAYIYLTTDLLKSDREMFFQYFAQIISEDGFIDKSITNFNEKKQQTPYENSSEITVEAEYPEENYDKIIEKVNDLTIRISGKSDTQNKKVQQNIEVDYGDNVIFPLSYRQDDNKYGLQFDALGSKFIAIRDENLDELAEKFENEEDIKSTQEQICTIMELNPSIELTQEETQQLKEIYGDILLELLTKENFSSQNAGESESYILELSSEQIKNIIIKCLEATKQNTLVIDKINERILANDSEAETLDANAIDDLIESINEEDVSEIPNLKITLVQSNEKLNQIVIESGESKATIIKNNTENNLSYNINFEMKGTTVKDTSIIAEEISSEEQYNIYFNVQYSGLQDLNNVQGNYGFGYSIIVEEQTMSYNYKINTNTHFNDAVSIEDLDADVAVFLNDYDSEAVTNFISQVGTRLGETNKKQMETLGLKEEENPLLYSNPITASASILVNNMADDVIDNTDLSEYEKQQLKITTQN